MVLRAFFSRLPSSPNYCAAPWCFAIGGMFFSYWSFPYLFPLSLYNVVSDSLFLFFLCFCRSLISRRFSLCCLSLPVVFYISMVDSLEVRRACPSISFLFAHLGGSLGVFPYLENFVFEGNCPSVVLGDLLPSLRQSLNWFEGLVRREVMSEVRSSDLKTGLSSNGDPVEGDTAVSAPREVRAFYALREACGLDAETVNRFKDRFQVPT